MRTHEKEEMLTEQYSERDIRGWDQCTRREINFGPKKGILLLRQESGRERNTCLGGDGI